MEIDMIQIKNKLFFSFIVCLFTMFGFGQTEEQLKFGFNDPIKFKNTIVSSHSFEELKTFYHSKSSYYDLYLDTKDLLLFNNKLSLRMRKRIFDGDTNQVSYTMQLKSEMSDTSSLRMEIDEPELDFYRVKHHGSWTSITNLMDKLFYAIDNEMVGATDSISYIMESLQSWITFKIGAPISPFQELIAKGFDLNQLKTLGPVLGGKSIRYRSHIYSEDLSYQSFLKNELKENNTPTFFNKNKANWLLESSLDESRFFILQDENYKSTVVSEYEVENKHSNANEGKKALLEYRNILENNYEAYPKLDSKYSQAIQQLKLHIKK